MATSTSLPQKLDLDLMQNRWATLLNPVLANLLVQGQFIEEIKLKANTPKEIQTQLGKKQQGWLLADNTAFCEVKRTKPFNAQTMTVEANADTTIALWVF